MKFSSRSLVPAPKRSLSLLAMVLLACSVAGLLAQSVPYDSTLERKIWKELLPWGENTGPNGEVIWADPIDLNNIPSSSPPDTWIDDSGNPVPRSVTPYGNSQASALTAAQTEFGLLGAIGECTYSHEGDYDLHTSIFWPQVRLCKGPQVPGAPVGTFAQLPPGPGRLLNPVGIAVSGAKVFVGDSFNHRVQVFDFFGNNIPMKYPIGNGIPGTAFYDYDTQYPGLNYRPYPGLADGGYSGHQLSAPQGIAVDAHEVLGELSPRLLVADTDNNRIALFNDDGSAAFETQVAPIHFYPPTPTEGANGPPQGDPFRPNQLAISPGAVIRAPGTPIDSNDPDFGKRIAVIDWYHCYVAITDVGFNLVKTLPAQRPAQVQHDSCHLPESGPSLPGQFSTVTGVEIDAAGNIYVSDHSQQQIQVFDRNGIYLTSIGKPGGTNPGGAGDLAGPVGLFIDEQFGRLGVIDADNARAVFYDITNGPAAVTFEFQIDTTVSVDDFPMGVAMQFGEEADGLDPKGRIMVTDPLRRRVLRWELPELAIVNATATITDPNVDPKLGIGSFEVVVPFQKLSPVLDVIVTLVPQDPGNVVIVAGSIVPSLASRPDIANGHVVRYTFQFTSTVPEATFDITARGDCDVNGQNCLAEAPDADAVARALCDGCAASHAVFYDFPADPDNPDPAVLVDTTDQTRFGRPIPGWYDRAVFVRIRPVVPPGTPANDPGRVTQIAWSYGGVGGLQYGSFITEVPTPGSDDKVDAFVRISGVTWVTYQAITNAGSASAPVEVLLPVDVDEPTM
ncbi:MAG: NHL repeat-containing protein, partial [Mycobacterium sp.]